jgi:branched-chain amino acid transport system ATP-binding protein
VGSALLSVEDLHAYYGKSHVLHGVTLRVDHGEAVAILGRNGMGKTTILRSVMGIVRSRQGRIQFDGHDLMRTPPHRVPGLGIVYVPQGRNVFPELTVVENLLISGVGGQEAARERLEAVFQVFPRLKQRERQLAGTLSGGEKQMLAIGRALVVRPKLLIMDEPSEGLSPKMVTMVRESLGRIRQEQGAGVLLVEQNVSLALSVADRVYLVEKGGITEEGTAAALGMKKDVLLRYLGVKL